MIGIDEPIEKRGRTLQKRVNTREIQSEAGASGIEGADVGSDRGGLRRRRAEGLILTAGPDDRLPFPGMPGPIVRRSP
jgi:hypothetical protein